MNGNDLPRIIQGGMGVAISGWPLARAVARTGQLGVVSGTALEVVCARRLQRGDPGGHVRRALAQFPLPGVAERILRIYYVAGGKAPQAAYRPVLRFTLQPARALQELAVAANFVEVFLAKEGHDGPVGINYLRKIEMPILFACYGTMLAGVDHVLVGAGNPADLPVLLDRLARHKPVALPVRVQGATSTDGDFAVHFDPRDLAPGDRPVLHRPRLDAIVASVDLATALAADPSIPPHGAQHDDRLTTIEKLQHASQQQPDTTKPVVPVRLWGAGGDSKSHRQTSGPDQGSSWSGPEFCGAEGI